MDPIIIPFAFATILAVAGIVTYLLLLRRERHRTNSK